VVRVAVWDLRVQAVLDRVLLLVLLVLVFLVEDLDPKDLESPREDQTLLL
jgi:hypothetical protein